MQSIRWTTRPARLVPAGLLTECPPPRSISEVEGEISRAKARWRDCHPDARHEAALRAQREGRDI